MCNVIALQKHYRNKLALLLQQQKQQAYQPIFLSPSHITTPTKVAMMRERFPKRGE